jgi:hypothetical protein
MKKCLICKKENADKKGSHIVPHFLIKRVDNESGNKDRDKELGFVIKPGHTTSYFGRAVLPEKLEELYGQIDDDLIENNKIDGIVDNYFCSGCEKKLSVIESAYSNSLKLTPEDKEEFISVDLPFVGFLFWASIFWRLSIQEGSGFKLKKKIENRIGRIISKYIDDDISKVLTDKNDVDLTEIGYKVLRSAPYSDGNPTLMHWQPNYERPYSIMVDEYIVFLYTKKSHLNGMVQDFYGSEKFKKLASFNTPFDKEKILAIQSKDFKSIYDRAIGFASKIRFKALNSNLDAIHRRLDGQGKYMSYTLKKEILDRIANSEEKLGFRHSIEDQAKIIFDVLSKHFKAK